MKTSLATFGARLIVGGTLITSVSPVLAQYRGTMPRGGMSGPSHMGSGFRPSPAPTPRMSPPRSFSGGSFGGGSGYHPPSMPRYNPGPSRPNISAAPRMPSYNAGIPRSNAPRPQAFSPQVPRWTGPGVPRMPSVAGPRPMPQPFGAGRPNVAFRPGGPAAGPRPSPGGMAIPPARSPLVAGGHQSGPIVHMPGRPAPTMRPMPARPGPVYPATLARGPILTRPRPNAFPARPGHDVGRPGGPRVPGSPLVATTAPVRPPGAPIALRPALSTPVLAPIVVGMPPAQPIPGLAVGGTSLPTVPLTVGSVPPPPAFTTPTLSIGGSSAPASPTFVAGSDGLIETDPGSAVEGIDPGAIASAGDDLGGGTIVAGGDAPVSYPIDSSPALTLPAPTSATGGGSTDGPAVESAGVASPGTPAAAPDGIPAEQEPAEPAADQALRIVTRQAVQHNPTDPAGAVAEVAQAFDIGDLAGKNASDQIAFARSHWAEVTADQAQALANVGRFVIVGRPGAVVMSKSGGPVTDSDGRKVHAAGRTAVVVPGTLSGGKYPVVAGSDRLWVKDAGGRVRAIPGPSTSASGQSADRAFRPEDLPYLKYYTPVVDVATNGDGSTSGM